MRCTLPGRLLALVVGLQMGWGAALPAAAKTRLVIGHYFTPGSFGTDAHFNLMETFVNEFRAKHPDIEVVHEPYAYDVLVDGKMLIQLMNKQAPTVWLTPNVYALNYADAGFLLDLTSWINTSNWVKNDFIPPILQSNADRAGRIWAIPQGLQLVGLYYNERFFTDRGVDYPSTSWTWDDYANAARKLVQIGGDGKTQVYGAAVTAGYPYTGWSIFRSLGGQPFDSTGTQSRINVPEMVRAVEYMANGVKQGYFSRGYIGDLSTVAMGLDQYVSVETLRKQQVPFNVSIVPMGPKGRFNPVVANSWVITKDAAPEAQQAAWEWIRHYSTPSVQSRWALYGDAAPANINAAREVFMNPNTSPKGLRIYVESMQYADWIGNNPVWEEWFFGAIVPPLEKAVAGEISPVEAATQANHAAQVVLDRYYQRGR